MASQGSRGGVVSSLLPFSRQSAERLDWHVGAELVGSPDRRERVSLTNPDTRCSLSVFEASDGTDIVRFRTAVGREKYFGVPRTVSREVVTDPPGSWRVDE